MERVRRVDSGQHVLLPCPPAHSHGSSPTWETLMSLPDRAGAQKGEQVACSAALGHPALFRDTRDPCVGYYHPTSPAPQLSPVFHGERRCNREPVSDEAQVDNTRPVGRIRASTLFYPAQHLVGSAELSLTVKEELHLYSPEITFVPLKATSRLVWLPVTMSVTPR